MSDNTDTKPTLKEKIKELPKTLKVFWKTPPKGRYLNLKEIACFGGSAFGMSTIVTIVSGLITATQIPTIYNFNVIHGAWICLIASVLGLIIQPFFSKLLQNTTTKFGRYKPFILILAPILAVFAILATWQPQETWKELFKPESARIIYAYCTCIPTLILWNLFQNTYYMLPGVVTPNQQERADIWSPIGLVIGFSPTVMNVLGNLIKGYFTADGKEYLAYRILGFVYAAVGLALVLCLFKVKERLIVTNENKEKVGLIEGLRMVVKNKPLMVLTLALVFGCCRTVVEIDAEYIGRLRYATTIDEGLQIFGALTMVTGFAATPNMILLPLLTRKFNSRTIMMFWAGCNTVGYLILASIGIENIPQGTWSVVILTLLRFVALFNAIASLQPLMMAQLSDYQQLKTGKRLEGFIQTFLYALVLVFTNIGIVVMAYVKDAMGYQSSYLVGRDNVAPNPTQEQIQSALDYFDIAFIVSAVSAALMFITLIFYKLGKKEHAEIVRQLRERGLAQGNKQEEAETVGIAERVEEEISVENAQEAAMISGETSADFAETPGDAAEVLADFSASTEDAADATLSADKDETLPDEDEAPADETPASETPPQDRE